MLYRRKILLTLIQLSGNNLSRQRFQLLLLLISRQQEQPAYDFVPHNNGPLSFTLNADLSAMIKTGLLEEHDKYICTRIENNSGFLIDNGDEIILRKVLADFDNKPESELVKLICNSYPYYNYFYERPVANLESVLFTIGYEGLSVENYLNKLLKNQVTLLTDVRYNPFSMKFGFSKNQLQSYCNEVGIEYVHLPSLGIPGELRKQFRNQDDMDKLFKKYQDQILPEAMSAQFQIIELLKQYQRISLTCFEADVNSCHRKYLVEALSKLSEFHYSVRHL